MPYQSIFRPGLFEGQTIIVTGGGSGIGRCTAHELRSLGARIALVGRTQAKLDQVKEELGDPGTFTFAGDLREEADVKAAVEAGRGDEARDHRIHPHAGVCPFDRRRQGDVGLAGARGAVVAHARSG